MEHREIKTIEAELIEACDKVRAIAEELAAARLAKFFADNGVKEGQKPLFYSEKTKKTVLVDSCDNHFPSGHVINKDGAKSVTRRILYKSDNYIFIGGQNEQNPA